MGCISLARAGTPLDLLGALSRSHMDLVVYGNDHRGHGRTALSPKQLGDFGPGGSKLLVVEDMVALSLIAKEENPGLPFILPGHSMGSFATQQFVLDHSEKSRWTGSYQGQAHSVGSRSSRNPVNVLSRKS
jgi:pimeloyl-ACP methyl ester carboxylesterase